MKKIYKGKLKLKDLKLKYDEFVINGKLDHLSGYQFAIEINVLTKGLLDNDKSTNINEQ